MAMFRLPVDNAIHGDQLVREIEQALNISIGDNYSFQPPNTVIIPHDDLDSQIQAIIDAHVPDPLFFERDRVARDRNLDLDQVADNVETELAWLDSTIPQIGGMTQVQARAVLERLARQNRAMLRAWRFALWRLR